MATPENEEFKALLSTLRGGGLDGSALAYVAANASFEQLRALASSPRTLRQFDRLYRAREALS